MTQIKAKTEEEATLSILLHQSKQSEKALARHIARMVRQLNHAAIRRIEADREMEAIIDKLHVAEREVRRLKALRYTSRGRGKIGVEGVAG